MRALQPYHFAWLSTHPDRTESWLRSMLADGFAIHHRDGFHDNDAPENLVLIEGVDHLRLHGMKLDSVKPRKGARGPQKRSSRSRLGRRYMLTPEFRAMEASA